MKHLKTIPSILSAGLILGLCCLVAGMSAHTAWHLIQYGWNLIP